MIDNRDDSVSDAERQADKVMGEIHRREQLFLFYVRSRNYTEAYKVFEQDSEVINELEMSDLSRVYCGLRDFNEEAGKRFKEKLHMYINERLSDKNYDFHLKMRQATDRASLIEKIAGPVDEEILFGLDDNIA